MNNVTIRDKEPTTLEKKLFDKIMQDSLDIERKIEENNNKIWHATPSYTPQYVLIDRRDFRGKIAYFIYRCLTPYSVKNKG